MNKIVEMDPAYSQEIFEILMNRAKKQLKGNEINEIIPTINKLSLMVAAHDAYASEGLSVATQLLQQKEVYMNTRAFPILASIIERTDDQYDQQMFHALLEALTVKPKYDDVVVPTILTALRILIERHPALAKEAVIPVSQLITIRDHDYKNSPRIQTLTAILKADSATLVQALKVANEMLNSEDEIVCIGGLTLLQFLADEDPAHYEPIFQLATSLVSDKNWRIRAHALRLVETVVKLYPACGQRALEIAHQVFQDKEIVIRQHALYLLELLIKTNKSYIPQACELAKQAAQDKKEDVRKANIDLLAAIVQADPSYAQNTNFKYVLDLAKLDKNKDIRHQAENLLK